MTGKSTTMQDIADRVGVSKALVSLVLRDAPGPSTQTRTKVLAAADELNYRPNRTASTLASRRTRLIGVVVSLRNTFHAELVEDIQETAKSLGYEVVLNALTASHGERLAIETLIDFRCEALMLLGPDLSRADLTALGERVPLVVLGRRVRSSSVDAVRTADDRGAGQLVDHLVALGHRDIVHVDGGAGTISSDRRRGYLRAMRRHGLAEHARVLPGGQTEDAGTHVARSLLEDGELPTAITAFNDRSAVGVLDALIRAGVDVPGAVSVAGYDDSPLAQLSHIDLTTVNQDPRQQASQAVEALLERLDDGRETPRDISLSPRLVVRGTTGPIA